MRLLSGFYSINSQIEYLGWEEQKEFRAAEIPFLVHLCTIQQTALRGVELSIQPFLQ
jgi:hypothetical protein